MEKINYKLIKKKMKPWTEKWANNTNKQFTKINIHIVNKRVKNFQIH